jgi:hypothetical protein
VCPGLNHRRRHRLETSCQLGFHVRHGISRSHAILENQASVNRVHDIFKFTSQQHFKLWHCPVNICPTSCMFRVGIPILSCKSLGKVRFSHPLLGQGDDPPLPACLSKSQLTNRGYDPINLQQYCTCIVLYCSLRIAPIFYVNTAIIQYTYTVCTGSHSM